MSARQALPESQGLQAPRAWSESRAQPESLVPLGRLAQPERQALLGLMVFRVSTDLPVKQEQLALPALLV